MTSSKEIFMQERERETFEAPKPRKTGTLPATVKEGMAILQKVKQQKELLIQTEKQLIEHVKRTAFAFENPDNLSENVITHMAMNPGRPYYYISKVNGWEFHTGRYKGAIDGFRHLYRNPFYDWDSIRGKGLISEEKRIDDK